MAICANPTSADAANARWPRRAIRPWQQHKRTGRPAQSFFARSGRNPVGNSVRNGRVRFRSERLTSSAPGSRQFDPERARRCGADSPNCRCLRGIPRCFAAGVRRPLLASLIADASAVRGERRSQNGGVRAFTRKPPHPSLASVVTDGEACNLYGS